MSEEAQAVTSRGGAEPSSGRLSATDLVSSAKNYVVLGKRHYGRTTLLQWLGLRLSDSLDIEHVRVPVFLTFEEIPKSSMVLQRRLEDGIRRLGAASDTPTATDVLGRGACVVLIDDISANTERLAAIRDVAARFPKCRWLLSAEEDLWASLNLEKPFDIGIAYETIHIRPLSRRQVRDLVRRWRGIQGEEVDDIVDEALGALAKMSIPVTPFLVSSVLWILESGKQLSLVNYAALLETLLDGFLEKAESATAQRGHLDYRNREHYLASVAWRMVERGQYAIDRVELEEETLNYFKRLGIRASAGALVEYMLRRGIFLQRGETVSFKYASFCRYFIAKWLMEDRSAHDAVMTRERYLEFAAELDLLSGLQRNNTELLHFLSEELDHTIKDAGGEIDLDWFEAVGKLGEKPLTTEGKEALLKRFTQRPSVEEREEMLDTMYEPLAKTPAQSIKRFSPREATDRAVRTLVLYSQTIRNCELVSEADKRAAVERAVRAWAQLMVALCLVTEELIEDGTYRKVYERVKEAASGRIESADGSGLKAAKFDLSEEQFADIVRILPPAFVQSLVKEVLGTPKLEGIIEDRLKGEAEPPAMQLLDAFLYADLKLPRYVKYLKALVKTHGSNRYVLEVALPKLASYYMLRSLPKEMVTELEAVISEVISRLASSGTRLIDGAKKTAAMKGLRMRRELWASRGEDDDS
jgi:hypothetical protein